MLQRLPVNGWAAEEPKDELPRVSARSKSTVSSDNPMSPARVTAAQTLYSKSCQSYSRRVPPDSRHDDDVVLEHPPNNKRSTGASDRYAVDTGMAVPGTENRAVEGKSGYGRISQPTHLTVCADNEQRKGGHRRANHRNTVQLQ